MNRIKILLTTIVLAAAVIILAPLIVNPVIKKKILSSLNQELPDYEVSIHKVRWQLIPSRLTLQDIAVRSKAPGENQNYLKGNIQSLQLRGIHLIKALFNKEYEIKDVVVTNSSVEGKLSLQKKDKPPVTSSINVRIDHVRFDQVNLSLKDSSSAQTLLVKEGMLGLKDIAIKAKDTLDSFHHFDFKAKSVVSNSPDSMYTYLVHGIAYADSARMLSLDSFFVNPNFERYDFTNRHPYETDRFEVKINDLKLLEFKGDDFFNSGDLISSCLSIGQMDLEAFRDKRREDSKEDKPAFQEYIYRYNALLKIDSLLLNGGSITYIEHADDANEAGRVHFNTVRAKVYNITNDTIYRTRDTSLTIIAEAMLMGKSKMNISLSAGLFDPLNTFSMNGSLGAMDVKELNPILENNVFINAEKARINQLKFNFIANDTKANGEIILLYDGLDLSVLNKRTAEEDGLKEQIISLIANKATWDANPLPEEEIRVGIIDYERDPTKFVFNYCLKAIVSGTKSTIIKTPKKKKSFLQRLFTSQQEPTKDSLQL